MAEPIQLELTVPEFTYRDTLTVEPAPEGARLKTATLTLKNVIVARDSIPELIAQLQAVYDTPTAAPTPGI